MGGGGISPLVFRIECRFFRFRFLYFTSDGGSSVVTYCYLFRVFRSRARHEASPPAEVLSVPAARKRTIEQNKNICARRQAPQGISGGLLWWKLRPFQCARLSLPAPGPHPDRFALRPPLKGEVIGLSSTDRSSTPLRRDGSGWREGCCSRVPALRRRQCRRSRARCAGSGLRAWVSANRLSR